MICQSTISTTTSAPKIQVGIFFSMPSNSFWQCGQKLMRFSLRSCTTNWEQCGQRQRMAHLLAGLA